MRIAAVRVHLSTCTRPWAWRSDVEEMMAAATWERVMTRGLWMVVVVIRASLRAAARAAARARLMVAAKVGLMVGARATLMAVARVKPIVRAEMAGIQMGRERRSRGSLSLERRKGHSQSWRHHRRIRCRRNSDSHCCRSHPSVARHSVARHSEVPQSGGVPSLVEVVMSTCLHTRRSPWSEPHPLRLPTRRS